MNALLVDDDYYVVTALETKIDWKSLQIDSVYTAHNIAQAREVIEQHPVHILISDIDMPQGSGLELLAWIRERKYKIQTIFLTNYANFNYAQKAIELQSFEYFLKPIEFDKLMLILQKAVARASEQQNHEKAIQEGYFWQRNQAKIREYFWRNTVNGTSAKSADIAHSIIEQNLPYGMDDVFQPLLINMFPYDGSLGKADKGLYHFSLLNVFHELFQHPGFSVETVFEYKPNHWIAILKWNPTSDLPGLEELCHRLISVANHILKSDACCTIASSGSLAIISQTIKQLLLTNEEIVKCRNQIFRVESLSCQSRMEYAPPNLPLLEELLDRNKPDVFLNETSQYLKGHLKHKSVNIYILSLFRLDLVQLVYSFLKTKGIQAHKLYTGGTYDQLTANSLASIEDLERYIEYLVNTAMEYRRFAEQPDSVVDRMKQYIHAHYGQDLSRNHLAEIVYLHPDYLARLFKRETGVSLGSYIIQTRLRAAVNLLETSPLSVYEIARKVGYVNYSYFLKIFKQEVGHSPYELKNKNKS